jgi:hypothetical protein
MSKGQAPLGEKPSITFNYIYTANGLELDFYVLRNFVDEIQPR